MSASPRIIPDLSCQVYVYYASLLNIISRRVVRMARLNGGDRLQYPG